MAQSAGRNFKVNPIRLFLHIEPQPPTVTHQEKKFGGVSKSGTPIFYPPPQLANARALLTAKLKPFAPEKPWVCPIMLCTEWVFRRPKNEHGIYMTRKPDTDNLQKMLKDVMTDCGFWKDDCLVCREVVEKVWHDPDEKHGILISITDLSNKGENND